jgi:hypothetical protein
MVVPECRSKYSHFLIADPVAVKAVPCKKEDIGKCESRLVLTNRA